MYSSGLKVSSLIYSAAGRYSSESLFIRMYRLKPSSIRPLNPPAGILLFIC